MTDEAVFAARKKRVTEQLGEAVFAAVGLMVRRYLEAPDVEFDGADFDAAAQEDRAETAGTESEGNESFDLTRYQRLRREASEAERGESGDRADAEKGTAHTARQRRAETPAGDADGREGTASRAESGAGYEAESGRARTAPPQHTVRRREESAAAEELEPQGGESAAAEKEEADGPQRPARRAPDGELRTVETVYVAEERNTPPERRSPQETAETDGDESADEEAARPMRRAAEEAEVSETLRRTERAAWKWTGETAEASRPAQAVRMAVFSERAEGEDPLRAARGVSEEIERDARRYDGNFYLY